MPSGTVKRLTMPKLAVILATLVSFTWIVLLYATPWNPANGPWAAMVLAVPVALSLWGLSGGRFYKVAGAALLVFALLTLFFFWLIGLSYLPSAILLLMS
jgi:hypothetical protein